MSRGRCRWCPVTNRWVVHVLAMLPSELASPVTRLDGAGQPSSMLLGAGWWRMKAADTEPAPSPTTMASFPFDFSLLQSMTATPESVVEYTTKYHQDCYQSCRVLPRGLRVPGHCNVCRVCSSSPAFLPLLVSLGFLCLGLVWFLFFLLCSKHEVFSTGPLNCGVEASICVIFGG